MLGEFSGAAHHGDPVTAADLEVQARARDDIAGVGRPLSADDRNRSQSAVDVPQSAVPGGSAAGDREVHVPDGNGVHRALQQGFHHGRGGQVGDIKSGEPLLAFIDGLAQNGIGQSGHHPHLRIGPPSEQGNLEVQRIVARSGDNGCCMRDPGGLQTGCCGQPDDADFGVIELFDDPHRQRIVAADDDVTGHGQTLLAR